MQDCPDCYMLPLLVLPLGELGDLHHALGGGSHAGGEESDIRHEMIRECNVGVVNVPVTRSARGIGEWVCGQLVARVVIASVRSAAWHIWNPTVTRMPHSSQAGDRCDRAMHAMQCA